MRCINEEKCKEIFGLYFVCHFPDCECYEEEIVDEIRNQKIVIRYFKLIKGLVLWSEVML